MCTKTKQKRERPSVPLTTRIDIPVAERLAKISEETGQALSIVMEKLLLYALDHVKLAEVTRKEMQFDDPAPSIQAMDDSRTIKERRIAIGMSQGDLADAMGVTQGAVAQWESGLTKPRINTLAKIAEVLGCTVDDLLKDNFADPEPNDQKEVNP